MTNAIHVPVYGFQKERLLPLMKERGVDVVLLTSPENVFYTTGYPCLPVSGQPMIYNLKGPLPFFSMVDSNGEVTLVCWNFAAEGVTFDVDRVIGFKTYPEFVEETRGFFKKMIKSNTRVGIETSCPYFMLQLLGEFSGEANYSIINDLLIKLRVIKSAKELDMIRKGTELIGKTLSEVFGQMYVGMSRLDLLEEARYRMFKHGATGISHLTLAFGATNPEIALFEELEKDKLVTLDLGAFCDGYASDNRRYVYTGSVPYKLTERHKQMVDIVDAIGAYLKPGRKFSEIYKHAQELSAKQNIELAYSHVGHSMGLETEELRINGQEETPVQENMALNIELFTKMDTGQSLGNEETYIIGKNGVERLTMWTRQIYEIGK